MVLLVPFDGSDLSKAALKRATEFADYREEDITALSVIPDDAEYARERGWLDADEAFDVAAIADRMREQAETIAPRASFRYEVPEDVSSIASTTTDITRTIREVAHEEGASIVFIGSENAGRVSTPVCSVGSPVSNDPHYDVHIVRHPKAT
ncbi:universal stress protein [Haloarcula sp. 1CSR25-25]|jgi:nucleotide-binding universal stress UspA family protein|uniref:universal stress protein n=1 Tax=Haloarcula sp. 1CSR25-25 TaxID=2862545 RepID=UPI00289464A1|nr:universal stress protein [Haloarcula sp. 1CSR25-25]MDT3434404.1 universal stress protein [Haloarcula sp. 1CSR25-25]